MQVYSLYPLLFHNYPVNSTNPNSSKIIVQRDSNCTGAVSGINLEVQDGSDFQCASYFTDGGGTPINCDDGEYTEITYIYSDADDNGSCDNLEVTRTRESCGGDRKSCLRGDNIVEFEGSALDSSDVFARYIFPTNESDATIISKDLPRPIALELETNKILSNFTQNNSCGNSGYHYLANSWENRTRTIDAGTNFNLGVVSTNDDENCNAANDGNNLGKYLRVTNPLNGFTLDLLQENDLLQVTSGTEEYNVRVVSVDVPNNCIEVNSFFENGFSAGSFRYSNVNSPWKLSNPFYDFECLDSAFDLKARIRLQIREWDRSFNSTSNIDRLSTQLEGTFNSPTTTSLTGSGTRFQSEINNPRLIKVGNEVFNVSTVISETQIDVSTTPVLVQGTALTGRVRPLLSDSGSSSADPFGVLYNNVSDWDDVNLFNQHPTLNQCTETVAPVPSGVNRLRYTFPRNDL